jgi:60 kDa SS-A/Ro ribonucleoprotein
MSRFNQTTTNTKHVINRAGGEAFQETPELALASLLLTSFLKDQYYRSGKDTMKELVGLVSQVDKYYAAQAAIYARNEFGMRSVSHVVAGEIGLHVHGQPWTRRFFDKVIRRPDDMLEIASYYHSQSGKRNWPNAMKKGFARALTRFNDYQLAKYRGEDKRISLVDIVNFSHPVTQDKKLAATFKALVDGKLRSAETWEAKLSKAGKSDDAKAEAWEDLLANRKIGYFALLRNLRNIRQQAPALIPIACELLQDEALIRKSLVLPFRYITAYEEVKTDRQLAQALTRAIDIACKNVPVFDGKTLVAVDVSGSMSGQPYDIAKLFAAIMYKATDSDILLFDSNTYQYTPNPDDSTLTIANSLPFNGGGTSYSVIFDEVTRQKARYDRIFILSDGQAWMDNAYWSTRSVKTAFADYRTKINPEVRLYSFDLQGYGELTFPEKSVYCIAGWSEKAFDVIKQLESGGSLVEEIKKVEI